MSGKRFAAVHAIAIVSLVGAQPTIAAPIAPSSSWQLDFGNNQCVAAREFGTGDAKRLMAIRPSIDGKTYEILVSAPGRGPEFADQIRGTVTLGTTPVGLWVLKSRSKDKSSLFVYRLTAQQIAPLRGAQSIGFANGRDGSVTFGLTSTSALFTMMDKCLAGLRQYWNMDAPTIAQVATPAKGDLRRHFSDEDFPKEAMVRAQEGTGAFLLQIDEEGSVANCSVTKASGIAVLDAMGCQVILERAKYVPAKDAAGKPIRSVVQTPDITWRLG